MKILLTVSYDGTNYAGWQVQKNAVTVQETLNSALSRLYSSEISVLGASRTDAGVHALCQKAAFTPEKNPIPPERLPYAVNSFLPQDITVTNAENVPFDFHPINDAKQKTYEYAVVCGDFPNPKERNFCEFIRGALDFDKMLEASRYFIGKHDFKAFCAAGNSVKSTVREIYDLTLTQEALYRGNSIKIKVTGNGFLYNMVRIISGTLIYVGQGKTAPDRIRHIINSKDRKNAGKTAPAKGLTLVDIKY